MNPQTHSNQGTNGEGETVSRRVFIRIGMGAVGACYATLLGYPVYAYLATPAQRAEQMAAVREVSLDGVDKLPRNAAMMFKFGTRPAMLIHHEDGTWSCFSAVCTHLGCTVQYEPDKNRIHCACHGGVYDPNTGANLAGPPPRPLTRLNVQVAEGRITVSRA